MILVVAPSTDEHVQAVMPALQRRGAAVTWIDLAELPAGGLLTAAFQSGVTPTATLQIRGQTIDLRAVTAVWAQRVRAPRPDPKLANTDLRDYVSKETADTWHGLLAITDCFWLPAPHWDELRAKSKPLQLALAAELGFETPPTLITNSPDAALEFRHAQPAPLISKTVHNRLLPVDASSVYSAYALTETIANRDLGNVDAIRSCPVTLQPYVDKHVELRVTIVGDRVFSAAIDSQWTNRTRRDWRRADPHHQRFAVHDLPAEVAERALALAKRLRLTLAGLDLILTPDGRYVFLEINPNGTWYWVQLGTGLPIAEAIADLLVTGAALNTSGGEARVQPPPPIRPAAAAIRFPTTRPAAIRLRRGTTATVASTVAWLSRLVNAGARPAKALESFRRFRARHRGVPMDLVWDFETYAGTFHYDVLVGVPGGRLSIAVSPDRGVPWAFRHAHHGRETDVLRVNGRVLSIETVMGQIGRLWQDAALVTDLIDGCLIRNAIDQRGLSATATEIDDAVEAFTRAHGSTPAAMKAEWRRRGWTTDDLRFELQRTVITEKLKKAIAGERIDEWFQRHHGTLDLAAIARLRLTDAGGATRVARQLRARGTTASDAVEAAVIDGDAMAAAYTVEIVRRRDLGADAARFVFAAVPGAVGGPFKSDGYWDVLRVLRTSPATLDDTTRALVVDRLFQDWLEHERERADVEWFWGDVERAPSRGRRS